MEREDHQEDTPPADPPPESQPPQGADLDALVDAVAADVLPGSGEKLAACREALRAAVEYLREHGTATRSDFIEDVYPDHDGGYTDGEDPASSWWTNAMEEGLAAMADQTDAIERPGRDEVRVFRSGHGQ